MIDVVFVDTGAWVALNDKADLYHARAADFLQSIAERTPLLTTNYVLDEMYTLLLVNTGYDYAVRFHDVVTALTSQGILSVVWVTPELADQAWQIFERFNRDKSWSFTDCVSYCIMQAANATTAFAFDHHFGQMGFERKP